MKYLVLLGDGMSDEPIPQLGNRTPLQAASTPHLDFMARHGRLGLAHTVPTGMPPGSDVANLSVFGYDPQSCYTGRSPLEAASVGVALGPADVAFRLNLVHLRPQGGRLYMESYSAGHITDAEGQELLGALSSALGSEEFEFHPGVGYRHLLIWRGGLDGMSATPPHDITGKEILSYLPQGEGADKLIYLMNAAQMVLHQHPLNRKRAESGHLTANSIWLWGHGRAPHMPSFQEKFGLSGAVISAVDLVRGIGICAGLEPIRVPGATGYVDTNYRGKAEAALAALEHHDFVYLHVEAPDEASHAGNLQDKLTGIERFDAEVVGTILSGVKHFGDYRILACPDHPTPLRLMTHTAEPVPFVLYAGELELHAEVDGYDEQSAAATGLVVAEGYRLMELLLGR